MQPLPIEPHYRLQFRQYLLIEFISRWLQSLSAMTSLNCSFPVLSIDTKSVQSVVLTLAEQYSKISSPIDSSTVFFSSMNNAFPVWCCVYSAALTVQRICTSGFWLLDCISMSAAAAEYIVGVWSDLLFFSWIAVRYKIPAACFTPQPRLQHIIQALESIPSEQLESPEACNIYYLSSEVTTC